MDGKVVVNSVASFWALEVVGSCVPNFSVRTDEGALLLISSREEAQGVWC